MALSFYNVIPVKFRSCVLSESYMPLLFRVGSAAADSPYLLALLISFSAAHAKRIDC